MKRSKLFLILIATFLLAVTTACGDTGHTHRYGEWSFTTTPTLVEAGVAEKTCSECGRKVSVDVPNLEDSSVWTVAHTVEPTCSTKGTDRYTSEYGTVDVTVNEVEHNYGEWTITVDPTVDATGKATHKCSFGETEEVEIAALTDTSVWTLKSSTVETCTEPAKATYESVYGVVTIVTKGATGHTFGAWTLTKEPTLTEKGSASRECHCGEKEEVEVAVLTDTSVWTAKEEKQVTCTEDGKTVYTSVYGTVTLTKKATGHTFGNWTLTKEPTLTEKGSASRECHCGEKEEVEVAVLTDETVWTLTETTPSTYDKTGSATYTSVYGTVTITLPKKAAPFANKTYSNFNVDADDDNNGYVNGKAKIDTTWGTATITLNAEGKGEGNAFPFRGLNIFTIVDELTGKIEIKQVPYKTNEDEETYLDYDDATVYVGYMDFATGLIVRSFRGAFNDILVLTPFVENTKQSVANASSWDNAIAIDYTENGQTYHTFVYKNVVYFGVSFVDAKGDAISADACYNAPVLRVLDKDGNTIENFGFNGEKEVVLDGFEGTYTNGENTLVVSGFGTVTLNGVNGTYEVVENLLCVYVENTYYEITLNKTANTYESVKPMVEVSFDCGEYATVAAVSVNKNIKYVLPTPTSDTMIFLGWYYDKDLTQAVEEFVPTTNVTLYANWKVKVVINLVNVLEGDATTVTMGEGEKLGSVLPKYTLNSTRTKKFVGWYLDETFTETVSEDYEVDAVDSGTTIYAKWIDLPVYYGTYTGIEVWAKATSGSSVTFSIDEAGNITGKYKGIVIGYDKETQKISWKESATASKVYYLWYDEATGIMATHYSSKTEIGTDYYIYSKDLSEKLVVNHYAVYGHKPNGTISGYYTRLVNILTNAGMVDVIVYGDHIYSNVSITNTLGEALTYDTLPNATTLVVRDQEGNIIVGLAAAAKTTGQTGTTFEQLGNSQELDAYFGTYTCGEKVVILDGTGVISVDGVLGTYEKVVDGSSYGFDVYLNNKSEYYELTLNGAECTLVKPMVTITFVVGDGHVSVPQQEFNINVVAKLPDATEENYVFNGWFFDAEFTKPVSSTYIPLENVTLYGKHSAPADLTINYNNTEKSQTIRYSVGDKVRVADPTYKKHKFEGWYTTSDFTAGTEWKSGSVINEDTTIYAKWSVAPIYNDKYLPVEVYGTNANGSTSNTYTRTSAVLDINPNGEAVCSAYPFSGNVVIKGYDKETGEMTLFAGSKEYRGIVDPTSGIIVLTYSAGEKATFGQVFVLVQTTSDNGADIKNDFFSSSYWNAGNTRVIEYTNNGTTTKIFVNNDKVYFGVSFKDAQGNDVVGKECYKAENLFVYASDNTLIAKFASDGTTLKELDGFEGTYTNEALTLEVNGVDKVKLGEVTGKYSVNKQSTDYTLDAYIENVYYEITLNKENHTFTINKPMVTITLQTEHQTQDPLVVNKNIAVTLPVLKDDNYKFRGWYFDAEFKKQVSAEYIPTADITVFAKWDAAVIVTIVYGNTLPNGEIQYGVGDTPTLTAPSYLNGLAFDGWFLDAEFTQTYKAGKLEGPLTVYCKWIEAVPQFGSYSGFEVYGKYLTSISISGGKSLKVDAKGKVTGQQTGTITEYNAETGSFVLLNNSNKKYAGYFDVENGIIIINYYEIGSDGVATLGYDQYVYFANRGNVTFDKNESGNFEGGTSRIIKVMFAAGEVKEAYIFIHNNRLYFNVSFTSNGNVIAGSKVGTSENVQVFDANGTLLATFNNGKLVA